MQPIAAAGSSRFQPPPAPAVACSHAAAYLALHESTGSGADCWQALSHVARSTDSLAFRANLLALDASLCDPLAAAAHGTPSVAARALQIDRAAAGLAADLQAMVSTVTERLRMAAMPPHIGIDAVESAIGLSGRLAVIVEQAWRAQHPAAVEQAAGQPEAHAPSTAATGAQPAVRELALLAQRIASAVDLLRGLTLGRVP